MKVMCIEQCKFKKFTIEPGEWLEVEDILLPSEKVYSQIYKFQRDGRQWIWKDRFITLEEYREQQLDKLI